MLERKVEFMSQDADFLFFLVRPKQYEDAYGSLTLQFHNNQNGQYIASLPYRKTHRSPQGSLRLFILFHEIVQTGYHSC